MFPIKERSFSKALLYISFRVPSKRSSPSTFPSQSSHRERCSVSRTLLNLSRRVRVNEPAPSTPEGPLLWELPISIAFCYIPLGVPNKHGLLIKKKSHLSVKVVCKWAPPPCSSSRAVWRETLHFQSQCFTHSFISLRNQLRSSPTKWRENISSQSKEHHADGWPTHNGVRPGFSSGSLMTLLSLPQCHVAFSSIPSTLAWVDQSPSSQCVS